VAAPRDVVWRALTDPAEVRRWFGWEYEGLEEEIRFIFVEHAKHEPPDRILFAADGTIELEDDGPRTIVRVVKPGPLADASWDDLYHEVVQGWRTFLQQLRDQLEHHPGAARRTVYLIGEVVPAEAAAALAARWPGPVRDEGRHQRTVAPPASAAPDGVGLVTLVTAPPLTARDRGHATLTVTAYDPDPVAFADLERSWTAWWSTLTG